MVIKRASTTIPIFRTLTLREGKSSPNHTPDSRLRKINQVLEEVFMRTEEKEILRLVREEMKEDPALTWTEAAHRVTRKNRDLAEKYLAAGRGQPIPEGHVKDPCEEMILLIAKKMEELPALSYADAMNLVAKENPDLFKTYMGR
jgi:hypothetical protein